MGVALNFLTQYKEDRNDFLEWIITSNASWIRLYKPERKSASIDWRKKERKKKEAPRKIKNEQFAKLVM